MRVSVFSPTYFGVGSLIGGAERYVDEFAKSLSAHLETRLISFSTARRSIRDGALKKEIYPVWSYINSNRMNPFELKSLLHPASSSICYVHGVCTLMSDLACLVSRWTGNKPLVMDHGGGAERVLNKRFPVYAHYCAGVAQSAFAAKRMPEAFLKKTHIIPGGINLEKYVPNSGGKKKDQILFVGRLLPHKAIEDLIEACRLLKDRKWNLKIIGRPYDEAYYKLLVQRAQDMPITFITNAEDHEIIAAYQESIVTVLPSVHRDLHGNYTEVPELMGFVLMESQACGTPVICTNAGGMKEFVTDKSGSVIPEHSPTQMAEAIEYWRSMHDRSEIVEICRESMNRFSWNRVVESHIKLFESL